MSELKDYLEVNLGNDYVAKIDYEDEDILRFGSWAPHKSKSGVYAYYRVREGGIRRRVWMHTLILENVLGRSLTKYELADHINGDKLDNRRGNLRLATRTKNEANKPKRKKGFVTSKYKGVSWDKQKNKWRVTITAGGRQKHLGFFPKDQEEEAAKAYNEAARWLFKEFSNVNIIVEKEK